MRILLTNHFLEVPGGTESYTYAIAQELSVRGHTIHVYTKSAGIMAARIQQYATLVSYPEQTYDLMLINHNTCLQDVIRFGSKGYVIFTSHGIFSPLEKPIVGADAYVAISEEVQAHMYDDGFNATCIHNGINIDFFNCSAKPSRTLQHVLCLCQGAHAYKKVKQACEARGLSLKYYHKKESPTWDMRGALEWSDLVVSLGRGAYEAMAMGREVLVYDERDYSPCKTSDGLVRPENFIELRMNNLSGRSKKISMTTDTLIHYWQMYDSEMAQQNRALIIKYMHISEKVDTYLNLYQRNRRDLNPQPQP